MRHMSDGLVDHATENCARCTERDHFSPSRARARSRFLSWFANLPCRKSRMPSSPCGVILQGETDHAENLSRSVTDALQRIAVDHGVPVINAVLSFDNEDPGARALSGR